MGGGIKSIAFPTLLDAIKHFFEAAVHVKFQIKTKTVPLCVIEQNWGAPGKPRIVVSIPWVTDRSSVESSAAFEDDRSRQGSL